MRRPNLGLARDSALACGGKAGLQDTWCPQEALASSGRAPTVGPDVRPCHSHGQTGPHTSFTSCRPHTARRGGPLLICEAGDEPREPLHAPRGPTSALLPFAPSQEDLQQPAPPQEDTAAKAEEEAAEEVSAGLPEYTGQACLPPGVPEPSGQPLDLLEPPWPGCEVPSGQRGGEDSQLGVVAGEGWGLELCVVILPQAKSGGD